MMTLVFRLRAVRVFSVPRSPACRAETAMPVYIEEAAARSRAVLCSWSGACCQDVVGKIHTKDRSRYAVDNLDPTYIFRCEMFWKSCRIQTPPSKHVRKACVIRVPPGKYVRKSRVTHIIPPGKHYLDLAHHTISIRNIPAPKYL